MTEYISREAIKQVLCGIANGLSVEETKAFKTKGVRALYKMQGAKEILNAIDNDLSFIPATDVQPEKQGRCVIDNEGYERCSVCNEHETGMRYFTFCPRCGARIGR